MNLKKNLLLLTSVVVLLINIKVMAQAPSIVWQKCLGGTGADGPTDIVRTPDGGYLICAYSYSADGDVDTSVGGSDIWLVKLDQARNIQWQRSLGGSGNDNGTNLLTTSGGGYITAGRTTSSDGDITGWHQGTTYYGAVTSDIWVVKVSDTGTILWQKCLGGSGDESTTDGFDQTSDGGYIIAGSTNSTDGDVSGWHTGNSAPNLPSSDAWIVKLNSSGNIDWQKCIGGTNDDYATAIHQTSDGGYIVAGSTSSNDGDVTGLRGGIDFWIVKLDNGGNIVWQQVLGGSGNDNALTVHQTSDGGYIAAGATRSADGDATDTHGASDAWIVKLDGAGNVIWHKCYGGTGDDAFGSIHETADSGYIAGGNTKSADGDVSGNHGGQDGWLLRTDHAGSMLWQQCYGGSATDGIAVIPDGSSYLLQGSTGSDDGDVSGWHYGVYSGTSTHTSDAWIAGLSGGSTSDIHGPATGDLIGIYPNPSGGRFVIETNGQVDQIQVYAASGILVSSQYTDRSSYAGVDLSAAASGIYFAKLISGSDVSVHKLIKQ